VLNGATLEGVQQMPARKKASSKKSAARKSAAVKKKTGTQKAGSKKVVKKVVKKKTTKAAPRKAATSKVAKKTTQKAPAKTAPKTAQKTAKKTAPKTTPAKAAAKPAKKAAVSTSANRSGKAPAIRSKRGRRAKTRKYFPPPPHLTGKGTDERKGKLGIKWNCYSCGAKFYDLNQPEPLCPKCGADQRERPAVPATPPPAPPKAKEARPLAPYLDDDDGATRDESLTSEDLDLELDGRVSVEDDTDPPTLDLDNPTLAADDD
jgi:hypothetical protein